MAEPAPGDVSFIEIGSTDAAVTRAFFASVFGWSEPGFGRFVNCIDPGGITFGLHQND
jgi:predicted enzyme related to lactoylglutathione lyase